MVLPLYEGVQACPLSISQRSTQVVRKYKPDKETNMRVVVGLVNLASWNLPRLEHPRPSLSLYDNQVLGRVLPRCELCELHVDSNSVTSALQGANFNM
jgi:hypothetical protein